jgi:hypothetical protein
MDFGLLPTPDLLAVNDLAWEVFGQTAREPGLYSSHQKQNHQYDHH